MYIQQMKFNNITAFVWTTADNKLSPSNPDFVLVQEALIKLGWVDECNHVFHKQGDTIHFTYEEHSYINLRRWALDFPAQYYKGDHEDFLYIIYLLFAKYHRRMDIFSELENEYLKIKQNKSNE